MDKSLWSLIQVVECPIHGDVNIDAFYDQWEIDRFMEDDEGQIPFPICDAEIAGIGT